VDIQTDLVPVGLVVVQFLTHYRGFRKRPSRRVVKYGCSLLRQKGLSPACQLNGSPRARKTARPAPIAPPLQTGRNCHKSTCSGQERARFRCPSIPRDHRRGQDIYGFPEETRNLCARGCRGCGVLFPDRQCETHRGLKDWQGSNDRNVERRRLFRRRLSGRAAPADVVCNRNDGLRRSAHRQESHDGSAASGTNFPTCSWPISCPGTSVTKKIWLITKPLPKVQKRYMGKGLALTN